MDTQSETAAPEPLRGSGERYGFVDLAQSRSVVLEAIMRSAQAPRLEQLTGWEFNGLNTASVTKPLGIRKFKKGFYRGPARVPHGPDPYVQGYNLAVRQNALQAPHIPRSSDRPRRFGFYRVHRVVPGSRDDLYSNALLLDYGLGGNGPRPERFLRDYLVQVYADDPNLLLGKAYVAAGPKRLAVSFFVLERSNPHDFTG